MKKWYARIICCIMMILGIYTFFYTQPIEYCVEGVSMEPTIHDGICVEIQKPTSIQRFDIVVFKHNDDRTFIKRVIGMAGDKIYIAYGVLYINDILYEEAYIDGNTIQNFEKMVYNFIVPNGTFFVLGDNRDVSIDSRMIGFIPQKEIIGIYT